MAEKELCYYRCVNIIIVMEKTSGSITDEERKVVNPKYAKYFASEIRIIKMYNIESGKIYPIGFEIKVNFDFINGEIIKVPYYESPKFGIPYKNDLTCAICDLDYFPESYTGKYLRCNIDGSII